MKHFLIISKKTLRNLLIFIIFAALVFFLAKQTTIFTQVSATIQKDNPIYFVYTDESKISLSFDAAWGCEHTEDILRVLDENGIKATFFLTNIWLEDYPEMAQEIASRGHEIAMHSTTHPHMNNLSTDEIIREIEDNKDLIISTTAYEPTLFRMPFGEYNNTVVGTVKELGYYLIQWSIDSLDWQDEATVATITKRVTEKLHNGAIILMHNNGTYTAAALAEIIHYAKNAGYTFMPIGELIYPTPYTVDTQGGQSAK